MDIKDLILLVGGFFFVAVVGHGLWIAWKTKQSGISMDISPGPLASRDAELSDFSKGEFPSGGARIASPTADIEPVMDSSAQPAQGSLPLDDFVEPLSNQTSEKFRGGAQAHQRGNISQSSLKSDSKSTSQTSGDVDLKSEQQSAQNSAGDDNEKRAAPSSTDELIILGVLAKSGAVFKGIELVDALRGQGLKFGSMSIFHRIDSSTQEHLFSVANAVEPGTFDLADMEALETRGITFFLQLPVPGDAFETLEDMLLSAKTVAAALGGDVKDDQMNMLTGQTVEHMRQRLSDYARRRLTQRPEL